MSGRAVMRLAVSAAGALVAWLALGGGGVRPAWAVDPFEIQVYDGTADAPLVPGLEVHVNGVVRGLTAAPPPSFAPDGQTHFTFEPSFGVTRSWELGAYLQTTLRSDGAYDFSGVKLRSKVVTPPGWRPHVRLGVNIELSAIPEAYDAERWGAEIRPIFAWEDRRFSFAVNPIIGVSLRDGSRAFEPAGMALVKIGEAVAVGLEYYADLGPLLAPDPLRDEQHYLFEVANLLAVRAFELNVGVGEGLTSASNPFVVKAIFGYAWEAPPWGGPPAPGAAESTTGLAETAGPSGP